MIDKYKKWEPIDDMPVEVYFISLFDDFTSLKILLGELYAKDNNKERNLEIVFDTVLMYRVTPEGSRLLFNDRITSNFNFSYHSDLLTWLHSESAEIHEDATLIYYLICNIDNLIEIVTTTEGRVEWKNL